MTYLIFIICTIMIVSWSVYSYVVFKSYKLNTKFVERQIKFMDNQEIISKREVESHLTKVLDHSEELQKENEKLKELLTKCRAELKITENKCKLISEIDKVLILTQEDKV